MLIRNIRTSDVDAIDNIYKKQSIGVPSLSNVVANRVAVNNQGDVVAYGVVKIFGELVLILDPDINKKSKVEVLRELMKLAIEHSKDAGLEQLYAISNSDSFTKVLCKQYGFRSCPGDLLMMDIDLTDRG